MKCEQIQLFFDDYIDNTLTPLQADAVTQHCNRCEVCSAQLKRMQVQKQALKLLPVPPASHGFEKRVIRNAINNARLEQPAVHRQLPFYKIAAAAMISAIVLWLGVFYDPAIIKKGIIEDTEYLVTVDNEVHFIKVAIDSEQAMESVDLRIELSDNLELAGFGNKKHINWTTGLQQGVNVLSLPIIGIAQGKGDITTRVRINNKEKVMRITTQYKTPGSVLYDNRAIEHG